MVHILILCKGSMFIDIPEGDFSTSASSQIYILLKQFLPITLYLILLTNKTNAQFFVPESSNINPVDKRQLHSSHRRADTKHSLNKRQIPFSFQLLFKKHFPEYTHIRIKHLQYHPWTTSKLLLSYKKLIDCCEYKDQWFFCDVRSSQCKDRRHKCQRLGNFPCLLGNCSGLSWVTGFQKCFYCFAVQSIATEIFSISLWTFQ